MDVSKNRGILPPKMDGLFHGKPYEQVDDLGGFPIFLETPIWFHETYSKHYAGKMIVHPKSSLL